MLFRNRVIIRIAAFVIVSFPLWAQDPPPPITWGEIPREDLEMKSFPGDTNASAVILCDYGESFIDNDLNIQCRTHQRIKILTPKGYDFGTKKLTINDKYERISDIRGMTYFLDSTGKMISRELDDDDIFKEEVRDHVIQRRFTLPALAPGCVIEVQYTITKKGIWYMDGWVFQSREPTRWSEYRIKAPRAIAYSIITLGYERFTINELLDVKQIYQDNARSYLGSGAVNCNFYRWALSNAPAIREEPFITTVDDYRNRIDVQLAGYAFPDGGSKKVLTTWEDFVSEILKEKAFGSFVDDTRAVRKQAGEITAGLESPEEKLRAVYDWVAQSIVLEHDGSIFADGDVDDVLENKKGNSAEITFLLLSLLKCIGIEGTPIILSTRGNGLIQDVYPIVSQFNYVMAKVTAGEKTWYLDATDELRPMETLPVKVLNVRALLMKKGPVEWVTLQPQKAYKETSVTNISLDETGSIKGDFEIVMKEYAAIGTRRALKDKEEKDIVKVEFETEKNNIAVDSFLVTDKDSVQKPLGLKAWVNAASYAQANGDFIYINPHFINRTSDNPLKTAVRKFPLDFAYQRQYANIVNLVIPDGFEVKEKVADRDYSAADGAVGYKRRVSVEQGRIQMSTIFKVNQVLVAPKFYTEIRDFYGRVVDTESEQFVLARIQAPPPPPAVIPEPPKAEQQPPPPPLKKEDAKKQKTGKAKK